jgi:hypothetical protein
MSRYTKELENDKYIAYGYDNALGYFFDLFGSPDEHGERDLVICESSILTKMSNGKMIELMDLFNLPESQIEQVAFDLPI